MPSYVGIAMVTYYPFCMGFHMDVRMTIGHAMVVYHFYMYELSQYRVDYTIVYRCAELVCDYQKFYFTIIASTITYTITIIVTALIVCGYFL